MDDLHLWYETLASLSRKSDTSEAIRYALSRWRVLGRYLDDGSTEIDNSAAERPRQLLFITPSPSRVQQLPRQNCPN